MVNGRELNLKRKGIKVLQTQEVPLVDETKKAKTKEDNLKRIVALHFEYILYHEHINREAVIGVIGDRGGGKSAASATWGLINFMLDDKPVWSNMDISFGIKVDDEIARELTDGRLKTGGLVVYKSLPLDKTALLRLDDTYRDGCLVIEEINVQFANARRFMANTNIDFNQVCQQLRKFNTSLIYNVIDEMFVDVQLRSLTDVFIKTHDKAFEINNLIHRTEKGNDFSWKVYPWTGYFAGEENKYEVTKKTLPLVTFHFASLHGLFDSTKHQEKGIYSQSRAESSKEMKDYMDEWQWLADKAIAIKEAGYEFIEPSELPYLIGRPVTKPIKEMLSVWGILWDNNAQCYSLDRFNQSPPPLDAKAINIT